MKKIVAFIGKNIKKISVSSQSKDFLTQQTRLFSHDVRTCIKIQEDDQLENYSKQQMLKNFNSILPELINSVADLREKNSEFHSVCQYLTKELQRKLADGDKNSGLAVLQSYQILRNTSSLEPETERLVQTMGWCVEMLRQSIMSMYDDSTSPSQDASSNDDLIDLNINTVLNSSLNQLLWKNFYNIPSFSHIMHLFHTVNHFATLGHALDKETHADKSLDQFTMNRYSTIIKYKLSYNTFTLPLLLSFYLVNITDEEIHRQAKTISLEMGHFYQVQKDYFDCYGNGASRANIAKGQLDWLSVVALQRVNRFQKQTLLDNYGEDNEESISKVKDLYGQIGIPKTYKIYEAHTYDLLCTQIQQCSRGLPHTVFFKLMERLYFQN